MDILIIIGIVVVVLVFFLSLRLFHNILKAALLAVLLIFILGVVGGVVVVNDMNQFREDFTENRTTYVLMENDTVVTGFDAKAFNFTTAEPIKRQDLPDSPENLSEEENVSDEKMYMFIQKDILVIPEVEGDNGMSVDGEELLASKDQSMQARGFMMAMTTTIMQKGPSFMLKNIQDGDVVLAPERPSFIMVQYTPKRLWEMAEDEFKMQKQELAGNNTNVTL